MPQNTYTYLAIDISKDSLQVQDSQGAIAVKNRRSGFERIAKRLEGVDSALVVCEATGGYERALVEFLRGSEIAVAVLNPARVKAFARSEGLRAKTDPIDARLLLRFAREKRIGPTRVPDPRSVELSDLLDRRGHLREQLAREKTRAQKSPACVIDSIRRMISLIEAELEEMEARIRDLVRRESLMLSRFEAMVAIRGVGEVTAWTILAHLSEIADVGRNQLVALAGVAPYNRDSGKHRGKRSIHGGRAKVRKCLFMAARTAAVHNSVIKPYVEALRQRGKPYKCAIVAAMRKLIIHIQSIIKKSEIILAQ